MDDSLKRIQEAYDKANFSDEMKKILPRPETEEDLKNYDKLLNTPIGYGSSWSYGLLWLILGMLFLPPFSNGMWDPNNVEYLKDVLKKHEDEKIDE